MRTCSCQIGNDSETNNRTVVNKIELIEGTRGTLDFQIIKLQLFYIYQLLVEHDN